MQILEKLGSGEGMPKEAIREATANRTAVAPLLIEALERHQPNNEMEENALFIAFHLLGEWREKSAYRPLAHFLRWPEVESIIGDATTETCHKVMANVFDGDPGPIYEIIHDARADEYVRGRMFDTLVILVRQGELDRTRISDFLRAAYSELQPQGRSHVWVGWQSAIAILALTELAPLVRKAFERGFIDEFDLSLDDFEDDLRRAGTGRLEEHQLKDLQPLGNVIDELSRWSAFRADKVKDEEEYEEDEEEWIPQRSATPARNPFRDVGRNDPCPCGSGKKFKKCCLGKVEASGDQFFADEPETDGLVWSYDPLIAPDPEAWLAADEQHLINVVEHFHRSHGFRLKRLRVHAIMHVVVEKQIAMGDKLPVRRTLSRLMAQGLDRHDAIHAIGSVLAAHINDLMRNKDVPADRDGNNAVYYSALERLTAKDWRNSG